MTSHDILIVLVMTFPMFIFTIFPGIKLGEYLEAHYNIQEKHKRAVVIVVTFAGALALSLFLHFA